jgi:hypothetical protein
LLKGYAWDRQFARDRADAFARGEDVQLAPGSGDGGARGMARDTDEPESMSDLFRAALGRI